MEPQIIKKAISGDSEALTKLIDKYKDIAYNLALSIVKNGDDAKDITQDSFLKVLENINRFRSDSKFSTWLYRIVYNQSIGFAKKITVRIRLIFQNLLKYLRIMTMKRTKSKNYTERLIYLMKLTEILLYFYILPKNR